MEQQELFGLLMELNAVMKDTNGIYHHITRYLGLSDCSFWILYLLRENSQEYTQASLCEPLSLSRQTVNSAIKSLEAEGYIRLEYSAGNRKSKVLYLTEKGQNFADQNIDQVMRAEMETLRQFSPEEQREFIRLNRKYANLLRHQTASMMNQNRKESP